MVRGANGGDGGTTTYDKNNPTRLIFIVMLMVRFQVKEDNIIINIQQQKQQQLRQKGTNWKIGRRRMNKRMYNPIHIQTHIRVMICQQCCIQQVNFDLTQSLLTVHLTNVFVFIELN
mmetsp:Transcript_20995/g.22441  ORF Transcript_20995/g.22441 Transcript_20995/m.22441 type:complete len:117 (+) Transcript_20995:25-375(+)